MILPIKLILALNAAIQASMAGDAGRGSAVATKYSDWLSAPLALRSKSKHW